MIDSQDETCRGAGAWNTDLRRTKISLRRFHITSSSIKEGQVTLDGKESHHALTVLRVKTGDAVELLDGQGGNFQGVVAGIEKGRVKVSVNAALSKPQAQDRVPITLAVSVIKPERMEIMVQKACELGVHAIVPLVTERTVVRLSRERWESKGQRWRKIAAESCKQCGQARTPEIQDVCEFKKFICFMGSAAWR